MNSKAVRHQFKSILKSQNGFTLIELVVVIAISSIIMLMISAIYINVLQTNINATVTTDVRENGQYMIEKMVRSIRSASSVTGVNCLPTASCNTSSITISTSNSISSNPITVYTPITQTYFLACDPTTSLPSLFLNDTNSALNTTKVKVFQGSADTAPGACDGTVNTSRSFFTVIPQLAGSLAPPQVVITLVLSSTGSLGGFHLEFVSKQTLSQLVELRGYIK